MYPTLITIGPITIYSFGLFLGLGILFGTYYFWKNGRLSALAEEKILDGAFLTIAGGLVGARFLYVASHWELFAEDIVSALAIWGGGLSFWGAILGGIVTIFILANKFHWPSGNLFDLAAPAAAIGGAFGYVGAFLAGSSYGAETDLPWGVLQQGLAGLRHPSQLLEAALQIVILVVILKIKKRSPFSGFLALVYLLIYSFGRFFFEFFRGDPTPFGPFSLDQTLSLLVGVTCALLLYLRLVRIQGSWRINPRHILKEPYARL